MFCKPISVTIMPHEVPAMPYSNSKFHLWLKPEAAFATLVFSEKQQQQLLLIQLQLVIIFLPICIWVSRAINSSHHSFLSCDQRDYCFFCNYHHHCYLRARTSGSTDKNGIYLVIFHFHANAFKTKNWTFFHDYSYIISSSWFIIKI